MSVYCHISNSIGQAENIRWKWRMKKKTIWKYVSSDLEQSYLQLDEHWIYRVSSYTYIDSPVNDEGLTDDAIRLNIRKAKRQLMMLRPVLTSKVLSVKSRTKQLETFVEPSTWTLGVIDSWQTRVIVEDTGEETITATQTFYKLVEFLAQRLALHELCEKKVVMKSLENMPPEISKCRDAKQYLNTYQKNENALNLTILEPRCSLALILDWQQKFPDIA
ncbi:hypothetical protein ACTXT7_010364 [Hymenolepis weldensis]